MYEVTKTVWFCAAHQVRFDGGRCEELHGHNWRVQVTVRARRLDAVGYVIDFATLKRATWECIQQFHEGNINEIPPFTERNPTAENLAAYVCDTLIHLFDDGQRWIHMVEVWETEHNRAAYLPDRTQPRDQPG